MKIAMIGAGRMGGDMVRRLLRHGHECVVYDRDRAAVAPLQRLGAQAAGSVRELTEALTPPRVVWVMIPAAAVDAALAGLVPYLQVGDTVVDGGNSHYQDDLRRAHLLEASGIHFVDVGTSGGVAGLERGYCLMIGGPEQAVARLEPIFASLAPGAAAAPATPGREDNAGTADRGYLHCGPHGAGHFVKMVHNGIEYGLMQAYAEGFNVLRHADFGARAAREESAETAPLHEPAHYGYRFDLPEIAELWRRGSVIPSWLLDLTAQALLADPALERYAGRVADSGEGRWVVNAALDEGVPTPVLSAALYARFSSRGRAAFGDQILSAMRRGFGGHAEPEA
ncbi:MAG: 6-phosphogluconate dehydrogenase (decarboxylating) [Gammaproteobacteria bacterium]|nr:6-phosphogluconate dehydrogenase (decarboxylating) [Gammaproteobacteria bacterium]|tara:strand:- start:792 stop:1808 length:1017 start_codon:yes stop_codon:yes gene_type:complete